MESQMAAAGGIITACNIFSTAGAGTNDSHSNAHW